MVERVSVRRNEVDEFESMGKEMSVNRPGWVCVMLLICAWTHQGCLILGGYEECAEIENDCANGNFSGADRLDNDCDGVVDEGCPCDFDQNMNGVCEDGVISQTFQLCEQPRYYVEDERGQCDGRDNDCDGQVDEGCPCNVDGSSAGVCALGQLAETGVCSKPVLYAVNETSCDGYDNDCDGMVDEGCEKCDFNGSLVGVCRQGRRIMMDGGQTVCAPPLNYVSEENDCADDPFARDNADNDCDGEIDEGCACNFGDATGGVCSQGRLINNSCESPMGYEISEMSCDGLDNDCNGFVDENCTSGG